MTPVGAGMDMPDCSHRGQYVSVVMLVTVEVISQLVL